jgi:hypothetical protein
MWSRFWHSVYFSDENRTTPVQITTTVSVIQLSVFICFYLGPFHGPCDSLLILLFRICCLALPCCTNCIRVLQLIHNSLQTFISLIVHDDLNTTASRTLNTLVSSQYFHIRWKYSFVKLALWFPTWKGKYDWVPSDKNFAKLRNSDSHTTSQDGLKKHQLAVNQQYRRALNCVLLVLLLKLSVIMPTADLFILQS